MTTIIGYTDSIQECECCGKINLKGTYCLDIDGEEFYYGSVCAFKNHGVTLDEQKIMKANFTKTQKNAVLYNLHIAPIELEMTTKLENMFTVTDNLPDFAKKLYTITKNEYIRVISLTAKKYKIVL